MLQIDDKVAFCEKIAPNFKVKPGSILTNWLNGFWAIPEKHQEKVLNLLKEEVNQLSEHATVKSE